MKIRDYTKVCFGLKGQSHVLLLVSIMLIVPLMMSCGVTKQVSQTQSNEVRDSLIIKEIQKVTPVTIPQEKTTVEIPISDLRKLPEGAVYNEKKGRLNVKVKYVPADTVRGSPEKIDITATCDSLQVLYKNTEKEFVRIRNDTSKEITKIKEDASRQKLTWFKFGFGCGMCLIAAFVLLIRRLRHFFNNKK